MSVIRGSLPLGNPDEHSRQCDAFSLVFTERPMLIGIVLGPATIGKSSMVVNFSLKPYGRGSFVCTVGIWIETVALILSTNRYSSKQSTG